MRLSKRLLRAAARRARELAMELVHDPDRHFGSSSWKTCALGEVMTRVGLKTFPEDKMLELDLLLPDSWGMCGMVSHAASDQTWGRQSGALVFPLLAWADAAQTAAITSAASAEQSDAPKAVSPLRAGGKEEA